jgi:hypothetical protein
MADLHDSDFHAARLVSQKIFFAEIITFIAITPFGHCRQAGWLPRFHGFFADIFAFFAVSFTEAAVSSFAFSVISPCFFIDETHAHTADTAAGCAIISDIDAYAIRLPLPPHHAAICY